MSEIVLNGLCLLLAIVCAWHTPSDQREVRLAALFFAANWLFYVSAWAPIPPVALFSLNGLPVRHEDLWTIADFVTGAAILLLAPHRPWAWALWLLYVCQCFFHILHDAGGLAFGSYAFALNMLFLGQVAVFVLIGGKAVGDSLVRHAPFRGLVRDVIAKAAWR